MRILLVEPDRILGETIKKALNEAGHEAIWKRTAQAALNSLDDSIPELIILEVQLGIHNGIEFLYEVNSYPEWQHIPVIVHTINAKAEDSIFSEPFKQLQVRAVLYKLRTTTAQLIKAANQFALVK